MPTLYILCGLPFSGKSMLAKEISLKTGFTVISYDDVDSEQITEVTKGW